MTPQAGARSPGRPHPSSAADAAGDGRVHALADRLDAALPQTQCTRCGYDDCRAYAEAIARGEAGIDRCPPGGAEGIVRLAAITGTPAPLPPLDPSCGVESPRGVAVIDEAWCIGCTLCIEACPTDCIVGQPKRMHAVIEPDCNGCELCMLACPVDCIQMLPASGAATGWAAWSPQQADHSRRLYALRQQRRARQAGEQLERQLAKAETKRQDLAAASRLTDPAALAARRQTVDAAIERARAKLAERRAANPKPPGGAGQP